MPAAVWHATVSVPVAATPVVLRALLCVLHAACCLQCVCQNAVFTVCACLHMRTYSCVPACLTDANLVVSIAAADSASKHSPPQASRWRAVSSDGSFFAHGVPLHYLFARLLCWGGVACIGAEVARPAALLLCGKFGPHMDVFTQSRACAWQLILCICAPVMQQPGVLVYRGKGGAALCFGVFHLLRGLGLGLLSSCAMQSGHANGGEWWHNSMHGGTSHQQWQQQASLTVVALTMCATCFCTCWTCGRPGIATGVLWKLLLLYVCVCGCFVCRY